MKTAKIGWWMLLFTPTWTSCNSNDGDVDTESTLRDSESETAEEGETETEVDLPLVSVDADDERILYTGRIDFSDPKAPAFSGGATYIKIRFSGVSVSALLDFPTVFGARRIFMDALIDDDAPLLIEPNPDAEGTYVIAKGLANTEHELTLVRRTQPERGISTFLGFEIQGELLDPPARPKRRIQIVGDSIGAGEGTDVKSASECADSWDENQRFQDTRLTFGPMLADALEAEYHVIAWSGKGLYQNYEDTYDGRLMPQLYDLLFIEEEDSPKWDPDLYIPDAVLIELGTNDYGPGNSAAAEYPRPSPDVDAFSSAYIDFVDTLLEYYPDVEVFALSSVLLSNGRPDASDTRKSDLEEALLMVEKHYADQGVDQVHGVMMNSVSAHGCDWHPNADQHQAMADELEPIVREALGW